MATTHLFGPGDPDAAKLRRKRQIAAQRRNEARRAEMTDKDENK